MTDPLLSVAVTREHDVVLARQRARQVAAALGFDITEQTRISTAVSEIARNAYSYAGGGRVLFAIEGTHPPQVLTIAVSDKGPGIARLDEVMSGSYRSATGMGLGCTDVADIDYETIITYTGGYDDKVMAKTQADV